MIYKVISLSLATLIFSACGGSGSDAITLNTKEELGRSLFFDANLSLNRTTSCATCHDPEHGFADARFLDATHNNPVSGALSLGDDGVALGGRNAPTAAYAMFSPEFHFDSNSSQYIGGQFHDGRAATLKDQAMGPPLDSAEMMMPTRASVIERIKENPDYIEAFEKHYGQTIFDDVNASYEAMGEAIGKFEKTEEFAPFDSKYDRYLECIENGNRRTVCLSEGNWTIPEELGMDLFFSEANTNCTTCHMLQTLPESQNETFSNYEYHNIGTPKNFAVLAYKGLETNATEHGILSQDDINDTALDGAIKVPTLRNVAITGPYMHNGVFQDLKTVLEFYDHMGDGERPLNPETGEAWKETDVNATINLDDLSMPELTDTKLDALEAFLKTLTDKRYEHLLEP